MHLSIAHELHAWLLHYSPAVLHGILPVDYYQHHLLLVEAVFLLLQDDVEERDIEQSLRLLKHYCFMFSHVYGKQSQRVALWVPVYCEISMKYVYNIIRTFVLQETNT